MSPEDTNGTPPRKFSRTQVFEATAAACLAAAVLGTSAGVGWLVMKLPDELSALKTQITEILKNQEASTRRVDKLEEEVDDIDRRVIRLEINP